jgi:hypothetical protein
MMKSYERVQNINEEVINYNMLQTNIIPNHLPRLLPQQQQNEEVEDVTTISSLTFSTCINSNIDHYFFNFNDIIVYTNSNDLLNLSIGLTHRQQRTFLSLNINAFRKKFDDIEWNIESNKMKCQPNAGGGSFLSEIFSCEIITRILDVQLFKTEVIVI